MPLIQATPKDIDSFMSFVDILPGGCWFWTGGRSRGKGNLKWYGSFWVPSLKTTVRAHRFSSEVFNKHECPPGFHREHNCCFSLCVCPECIEVVSREVNQERSVISRRNTAMKKDRTLLISRYGLDSFQ
jgi:hypothetical protein